MDFYATLGVPKDAGPETIRDAYRMLARRYHPDRGAGSSPDKFRQVAEAFATLIDPGRRHQYDLTFSPVRRPVMMRRVEPMTARAGSVRQEDPDVFGYRGCMGHVEAERFSSTSPSYGLDDVFYELICAYQDIFFDYPSRW